MGVFVCTFYGKMCRNQSENILFQFFEKAVQNYKACSPLFMYFLAVGCFSNRHCCYGIPSFDDTPLLQMVSKCRKCCRAGSKLILKFVCDLFGNRYQLDLYCGIKQGNELFSCCFLILIKRSIMIRIIDLLLN